MIDNPLLTSKAHVSLNSYIMTNIKLSPAQTLALAELNEQFPYANLTVLIADDGKGRTSILERFHSEIGGKFLDIKDFLDALKGNHPLALEETLESWMRRAINDNEIVFVDDFHLLSAACTHYHSWRYKNVFKLVMTSICDFVRKTNKKLILGSSSEVDNMGDHASIATLKGFETIDYEAIGSQYLSEGLSSGIDYSKIHRFAPELNAHQLSNSCKRLTQRESLGTEEFIEYLRSQYLSSNVDLQEVQAVELSDLRGMDELIASLETNLILPMENTEIAERFNLKPKRGVLLAGHPGTGKTTVGRALAHRLKSKFFLLDGTVISGTEDFYSSIGRIFEMAKHNSPSILFIDDSDVIFESGQESGLYRYLLTMLDGLESATAGRVCVMMTAMNVSAIPPALMRSGRVELWLETVLPDSEARADILKQRLSGLPAEFDSVDIPRLSVATDGLTGADLKRLVEDGKLLYAADVVKNAVLKPIDDYFLASLETLVSNKQRYAQADHAAREKQPSARPPWFDAGNP